MSIWGKLLGAAAGLAVGGPLGALVGAVLGHAALDRPLAKRALARDPERRQVAFSIAAIALAAKMARADGDATEEEFFAFRRLFHVAPAEEANVVRFWNQARQCSAGYEAYAKQVASLLGPGTPILQDLLDALFLIAVADPPIAQAELDYLRSVAQLFGFDAATFARVQRRHMAPDPDDPHVILEVEPGASREAIKAAYRRLARETHPDILHAQGVPPEFQRMAQARMAVINAAYAALTKEADARPARAA
jgi:DnaJ like chaperone protein